MRTTPSRAVLLGRSSIVMVLMALGMAVFSQSTQPRPSAPRPSPSPSAVAASGEITWEEADRLVGEQKYEAAAAVIAQVRARAQARGDEDEWTRALVREAQLRSALHGFETVVRFLRETPWPPGPRGQGRAGPLLRPDPRPLPPGLLVGDPAARARRIEGSRSISRSGPWTRSRRRPRGCTHASSRERDRHRRRSRRPHRRLPAARHLSRARTGHGAGCRVLPDRRAAGGHRALDARRSTSSTGST